MAKDKSDCRDVPEKRIQTKFLSRVDQLNNSLPISELKGFCRQWGISEFALFGSILHPNFDEKSDIDIMISFHPNIRRGLFDHVQMQQELAQMLGRSVDLVTRRGVERSANWRIRKNILSGARALIRNEVFQKKLSF